MLIFVFILLHPIPERNYSIIGFAGKKRKIMTKDGKNNGFLKFFLS